MSDGRWQLVSGQLRVGELRVDVGACVNRGLPEMRLPERPDADIMGKLTAQCEMRVFTPCLVLGNLYRQGAIVPKDLAKAREYYEKVCWAGYTQGCLLRDSVDAERLGAAPP
jgi:TPR repeat protein